MVWKNVLISSLYMQLPVFPAALIGETVFLYLSTIFWKDPSFLIGWSWHPFWKSVAHKCVGLFLDSQFSSIVMCPMPVPQSYLLAFHTKVHVMSVSPPTCLFLFQDCFGCSESLHFHMNFRISLSTSAWKKKRRLIFWYRLHWTYWPIWGVLPS